MMKKTLTEKRYYEWTEDSKSVTLRKNSASIGGGSEVLVIEMLSEACVQEITRVSERNMSTKEN